MDLLVWRDDAQVPRPEILYWRTASELEVDFVIEHRRGLLPIEVKATAQPGAGAARGLQAFRDEYPISSSAGCCSTTARRRNGSRIGFSLRRGTESFEQYPKWNFDGMIEDAQLGLLHRPRHRAER